MTTSAARTEAAAKTWSKASVKFASPSRIGSRNQPAEPQPGRSLAYTTTVMIAHSHLPRCVRSWFSGPVVSPL